jgi:hypothetical protein
MREKRTRAFGMFGMGLPGGKAAMVLVAVALAYCASCFGLDPSLDISQYAHTSWEIRDGFAKGMILSVAQSPDGYLWLGSEFGLLRFDGVHAMPWQPPLGQQLPSSIINSLFFSRDGTLWSAFPMGFGGGNPAPRSFSLPRRMRLASSLLAKTTNMPFWLR